MGANPFKLVILIASGYASVHPINTFPKRERTLLKSLSAKIIAAAVVLITVSSVADFFIASNISSTLNHESKALTKGMQSAITEKDALIRKISEENLNTAQKNLEAEHAKAIAENTLTTEMTRKFLEGTRNGIAVSSLTLIKNAMMMGEAASAQDTMDTLLENPEIFAINLWRTTGEMAFRDNQTIDAINKLADDEAFAPRTAEDPILIPAGGRAETLAKVVESHQSGQITTGEVNNDDGTTEPVEYAYYLLENEENCQGCHGETTTPRGILEVAVSRAALIDLEHRATTQMADMDALQASEKAKLEEENAANTQDVRIQTERVSAEVAQGHARVAKAESSASTMSILTKIGFFIVTIGVLFLVMNTLLTKPVHAMTNAMGRLAEGDLDAEIPAIGREDEIGLMASAVQVFKENATEVKRLEGERAEVERRALRDKATAMQELADAFESSVGTVVRAVSTAAEGMETSSEGLAATAEQTSDRSQMVTNAAEQASANVQTVASAAEELSAAISEISRQVAQSTIISGDAVAEIHATNEQVQGLSNAANRIGEVVALITDIADQTNLLALNATIEAARAGDAGKGFAVVAGEVKNLANQTAKATEEISSQVDAIQGATQGAVEAIKNVGSTIDRISEIASAIASAVEEQGAATQEIARNVELASSGTMEVSTSIRDVNKAAEDTGVAATDIRTAAQDLSKQSNHLSEEVANFLVAIRPKPKELG